MAKYELSRLGSFSYGGTVYHREDGNTFHEDHGYAQYFIPEKSRNYPIIFWHGLGQSGVCYERDIESGEGFMQDFLADRYACYVVDQPRRGRAAKTRSVPPANTDWPGTTNESSVFTGFRLGKWFPPEKAQPFDDLQFPLTPLGIDQFMRQQAPDTGIEPLTSEYIRELGENMGQLMEQTGDGILFTHSMSGKYGWFAGMYGGNHIKAIVSYEPGGQFAWPDGQFPQIYSPVQDILDKFIGMLSVPKADFKKLAKIPVRIIYGDHIAKEPVADFNQDKWRIAVERARKFVELLNEYGGDAKLILLPELGIKGNGHNGFQEKNHTQIAEIVKEELRALGLASDNEPTSGPKPKNVPEFTIPLA